VPIISLIEAVVACPVQRSNVTPVRPSPQLETPTKQDIPLYDEDVDGDMGPVSRVLAIKCNIAKTNRSIQVSGNEYALNLRKDKNNSKSSAVKFPFFSVKYSEYILMFLTALPVQYHRLIAK
jgi:hypothetical protein